MRLGRIYFVRRIGMATNGNTLSKPGIKGDNWRPYKTRWLSKSVTNKLWRSKRALLGALLLASSAVALTSFSVQRAMRPAPSIVPVVTSASTANAASTTNGAIVAYEPPATSIPLTKLREYVYAGD